MRRFIILLILFAFASCSVPMKSVPDAHRNSKKSKAVHYNPTPKLTLLEIDWRKKRASRGLASVSPATVEVDQKVKKMGNKHIYFIALYGQYMQLNALLNNQMPSLKTCPNFHSTLAGNNLYSLKYSPKNLKNIHLRYGPKNKLKNNIVKASYPELSLPVSKENEFPTVSDLIEQHGPDKEVLTQALKVHLKKTYEELSELCEYGDGHNYFIYINLVSHFKDNPRDKKSEMAMRALLNVPIFNNRALMESLGVNSSKLSIVMNSEIEVYNRAQAQWSKLYFDELALKRKQFAQ